MKEIILKDVEYIECREVVTYITVYHLKDNVQVILK